MSNIELGGWAAIILGAVMALAGAPIFGIVIMLAAGGLVYNRRSRAAAARRGQL